jgi:hypothetical protein
MDVLSMKGKRLYEMTTRELQEAADYYDQAGNAMWATLCREQISLNRRVLQAFLRDSQSSGGSEHGT